jgi:thiamine-monophosphate kinase
MTVFWIALRSGAKRGDLLCVTGQIGLPITALAYFNRARHLGFSLSPTEEEDLLRAWKRPVPRIKEGLILSKHKIASSCQDISDGLKVTIEQIATASGVTFTIHSERLPVHQSTKKVAEFFKIPFPQLAISASVDFQLLFTMPSTSQSFCDSLFASEGLAYHVIGDVNDMNENLMVDVDGNIKSLPGVGWNHQSGDLLQQILGT